MKIQGNIIIGQSGGPTAAINATLAGVFYEGTQRCDGKIFGMLGGVEGLLSENIVDLREHIKGEKELELLNFLASHPNKVFTRNQLLDDVWGFEYFGDSRTVDVHVKRLREKLDGASDKWSLKTVWGVGYKFELIED